MAGDPAFGLDAEDLAALSRPDGLVGRAPEQVESFVAGTVDPLLEGFEPGERVELRV